MSDLTYFGTKVWHSLRLTEPGEYTGKNFNLYQAWLETDEAMEACRKSRGPYKAMKAKIRELVKAPEQPTPYLKMPHAK
jgi:hypothetical protein